MQRSRWLRAYSYANSAADELIEQRIPHRLAPGKNHGKVDSGGWQWDLRVDAEGEEGVLDELQRRVWAFQAARFEALQAAYDASDIGGVYLLDESEPPEANLHVVITSVAALSAVRFRSFLRDCRAIERPPSELLQVLEKERATLADFIDAQHTEIKKTHDPKVTRLVRRPKIRVMKGVLRSVSSKERVLRGLPFPTAPSQSLRSVARRGHYRWS